MLFKIFVIRLFVKINNVFIIIIVRSSGVLFLSFVLVRVDFSFGYEKICLVRMDFLNNFLK